MTTKQNFRGVLSLIFFFLGVFIGIPALIVAVFGYQGNPQVSHYSLLYPFVSAFSFLLCWVMGEDE